MSCMRRSWLLAALSLWAGSVIAVEPWFEEVKAKATPEQLYSFLYALPKGGDLHNHLEGAARSEWLWESALAQQQRGYAYYTKVKNQNCAPYGSDQFAYRPYSLLFLHVTQGDYEKLGTCEKSEYKLLTDLNETERTAWLNSVRLDAPHEGRGEFFEAHFQRLGVLFDNPWLTTDMLYRNMQALGAEGVVYLETMIGIDGYSKPDGSPFTEAEVGAIFRERLASREAKPTGVEVRLQNYLVRFLPGAEERLKYLYASVDRNRDLYVGINMVGREDNDKGHPLRFLPTLRELRHRYPEINLAIHAGEVDEPNAHVRDTLLLGAERIGHGVNLISDPDTMLRMRHGPYLVEINLISNLLLEYVSQYSQHPFPEYLRTGIPVALSTDDRGMWDSNLTDEYFVAVREFNLSWDEIVSLGRNSLQHAFVEASIKQRLLSDYDKRVSSFAQQFQKQGWAALRNVRPVSYSFLCRRYKVCLRDTPQ